MLATDCGVFTYWRECALGSGLEATVYLGIDARTGRRVAIKHKSEAVDSPWQDAACVVERRADHPAFVQLIATTTINGEDAEVYEFVLLRLGPVDRAGGRGHGRVGDENSGGWYGVLAQPGPHSRRFEAGECVPGCERVVLPSGILVWRVVSMTDTFTRPRMSVHSMWLWLRAVVA